MVPTWLRHPGEGRFSVLWIGLFSFNQSLCQVSSHACDPPVEMLCLSGCQDLPSLWEPVINWQIASNREVLFLLFWNRRHGVYCHYCILNFFGRYFLEEIWSYAHPRDSVFPEGMQLILFSCPGTIQTPEGDYRWSYNQDFSSNLASAKRVGKFHGLYYLMQHLEVCGLCLFLFIPKSVWNSELFSPWRGRRVFFSNPVPLRFCSRDSRQDAVIISCDFSVYCTIFFSLSPYKIEQLWRTGEQSESSHHNFSGLYIKGFARLTWGRVHLVCSLVVSPVYRLVLYWWKGGFFFGSFVRVNFYYFFLLETLALSRMCAVQAILLQSFL